jgi:hypothetical protein
MALSTSACACRCACAGREAARVRELCCVQTTERARERKEEVYACAALRRAPAQRGRTRAGGAVAALYRPSDARRSSCAQHSGGGGVQCGDKVIRWERIARKQRCVCVRAVREGAAAPPMGAPWRTHRPTK